MTRLVRLKPHDGQICAGILLHDIQYTLPAQQTQMWLLSRVGDSSTLRWQGTGNLSQSFDTRQLCYRSQRHYPELNAEVKTKDFSYVRTDHQGVQRSRRAAVHVIFV